MTPNSLTGPVLAALFVILASCASTPPPRSALESAHAAVQEAEDLDASTWAPVELGRARQRLDLAEIALTRRDYAQAEEASAQALLEARLAQYRSRAAKLREQVQTRTDDNQRLRHELLGEEELP